MPAMITLKNIPDDLVARLKLSAAVHRHSLSFEAIVCLEKVLFPKKVAASERIARARELRSGLIPAKIDAGAIEALKRMGRP